MIKQILRVLKCNDYIEFVGMKIDFLIAGVQKAATTALHVFLSEHPQIFMPEKKELHFFDLERRVDWSKPDYSSYHAHFKDHRPGHILGEATPIYLYWAPSIQRLHAYNSELRLIVSLREPVGRAYSHWKMEISQDKEVLDFSSVIRDGRTRVKEDGHSFMDCHRVFSYVERGSYAPQIHRLLRYFSREQVLFLTVDQLKSQPEQLFKRIWTFLGVDSHEVNTTKTINPRSKREGLATLNAQDSVYLQKLYHDDIVQTAKLTGLDLSNWIL